MAQLIPERPHLSSRMRRMFSLLLLVLVAQSPAAPGETTVVSFCKQGRLTACEELAKVNPQQAAEIRAELAKAALRLQTLKAAEEEARAKDAQEAEAAEAEGEAAPEPPDCQGQEHHVISRPIAKALGRHETLSGLYEPRDERYVAKAKDEESHCGYQKWHRDVDLEVMNWLRDHKKATQEQFEALLREIYNRPDMLKRFPRGFGPAT
jgi:hypothetical protein